MADKVLVLLAAYNGESYIREQLDSIIAQDYVNWELAIQDDGSTDSTEQIVTEYCERDPRIKFYRNESTHHGPYYNFHYLTNRFKGIDGYDFYMYADQDDIWFPNKMSKMLQSIKKHQTPTLLYADMSLCDESGKMTDPSLDSSFKMNGRDRYNVYFCHKIFGCNMMLNKALFDLMPSIDPELPNLNILSHDNLTAKFAATFGEIEYFSEPTMLYRKHDKAVTNRSYYKRSVSYIIKRMFAWGALAKAHAHIYNQSIIAINMLKEAASGDDEKLDYLNEIENAIRKGGFAALSYLFKHRVDCGRLSENISRRLILFLGLHRKYLIEQ